jgi:hypothetical protein
MNYSYSIDTFAVVAYVAGSGVFGLIETLAAPVGFVPNDRIHRLAAELTAAE